MRKTWAKLVAKLFNGGGKTQALNTARLGAVGGDVVNYQYFSQPLPGFLPRPFTVFSSVNNSLSHTIHTTYYYNYLFKLHIVN
jgi:hypothetical protein